MCFGSTFDTLVTGRPERVDTESGKGIPRSGRGGAGAGRGGCAPRRLGVGGVRAVYLDSRRWGLMAPNLSRSRNPLELRFLELSAYQLKCCRCWLLLILLPLLWLSESRVNLSLLNGDLTAYISTFYRTILSLCYVLTQ